MPNISLSSVNEFQQAIGATALSYKNSFATPTSLNNAYPLGSVGDFASVVSTGTFWLWDEGQNGWVDTGAKATANFYNKTEVDALIQNQAVGATTIKVTSATTVNKAYAIVYCLITSAANIIVTLDKTNIATVHGWQIENALSSLTGYSVVVTLPVGYVFADGSNTVSLDKGESISIFYDAALNTFRY